MTKARKPALPPLVALYILHGAIGFGLSLVFVSGLLWFDIANLRHLVTHSDAGPLAVFLLWMFNGLVFGGAQFGIAVMRLHRS